MWDVRKEHNKRIVHNTHLTWKLIWVRICKCIRDSIYLLRWDAEDFKCEPQECPLLEAWIFNLRPTLPTPSSSGLQMSSPSLWCTPPSGFIKLKFNGASKGNPGPAGCGGVFKNSLGIILYIYIGSLGHECNNTTELWVLFQ